MSKKVVEMHFVEHAKTMLFIVREPHGDLPEKVQKRFFSRARCEGAPGSIWKRIWADFLRFWCFLGTLWGSRGGPTNHLFVYISDFACFGGPLEGTGSPDDPRGHQNDIKMDPETGKITTKSTSRLTKQLHNKLNTTEQDNRTTTSDAFDTLMNR